MGWDEKVSSNISCANVGCNLYCSVFLPLDDELDPRTIIHIPPDPSLLTIGTSLELHAELHTATTTR